MFSPFSLPPCILFTSCCISFGPSYLNPKHLLSLGNIFKVSGFLEACLSAGAPASSSPPAPRRVLTWS